MPAQSQRRVDPRAAADPPGTGARRAALQMIDAVMRKGLPLEAALGAATAALARPDDRALARNIASTVLRRLTDLDALIDSATPRPLPDDAKVRSVLRLALAQVLALGTPPHAAISTSLPLLAGGPRKLLHGVFGALMRGGASLPTAAALPAPVAARWRTNWGDDVTDAAGRTIASQPETDLCGRDSAAFEGIEGVSLLPGHLRVGRSDVTNLEGFDQGRWWVQDLAATLPARLLGRGTGRTALDLCAAPGGKTMQLAAAGFAVTALDNSHSRLARLRDNLERTKLAAELVEADVMKWEPPRLYDAILLDAPCSATGIFRRHPDVLHRVRPPAIAELAAQQTRMLARAAKWLAPEGRLIYAACSLEPEEGEGVVRDFLVERPDWALDAVRPDELPAGISATGEGWLRLLPGALEAEGGLDGFFIARLRG